VAHGTAPLVDDGPKLVIVFHAIGYPKGVQFTQVDRAIPVFGINAFCHALFAFVIAKAIDRIVEWADITILGTGFSPNLMTFKALIALTEDIAPLVFVTKCLCLHTQFFIACFVSVEVGHIA
jgi:hypothetical protein